MRIKWLVKEQYQARDYYLTLVLCKYDKMQKKRNYYLLVIFHYYLSIYKFDWQ